MPAGPWVLVVGMHRSGTSAIAGSLGALGFNLFRPEDRMDWPESNPEHWESLPLGLHNEGLLNRLGGSWDAPPDLVRHWVHSAWILSGDDSGAVLAQSYPSPGPAVWKDPRLCLLLPYWRTVLPTPTVALFVWRKPMAVARSLYRRDGMPLAVGLALWERYNRCAIEGMNGMDTFVVDYDAVVSDPMGFARESAGWLGSLAQFASAHSGWDPDRSAQSISQELYHRTEPPGREDASLLSPEQLALGDTLMEMAGGHRPLRQPLPTGETAWSTALIANRRDVSLLAAAAAAARQRFWTTRGQLAQANADLAQANAEPRRKPTDALTRCGGSSTRPRQQLEAAEQSLADVTAHLAEMHESTSWRITKPLRSSASIVERWVRQTEAR